MGKQPSGLDSGRETQGAPLTNGVVSLAVLRNGAWAWRSVVAVGPPTDGTSTQMAMTTVEVRDLPPLPSQQSESIILGAPRSRKQMLQRAASPLQHL